MSNTSSLCIQKENRTLDPTSEVCCVDDAFGSPCFIVRPSTQEQVNNKRQLCSGAVSDVLSIKNDNLGVPLSRGNQRNMKKNISMHLIDCMPAPVVYETDPTKTVEINMLKEMLCVKELGKNRRVSYTMTLLIGKTSLTVRPVWDLQRRNMAPVMSSQSTAKGKVTSCGGQPGVFSKTQIKTSLPRLARTLTLLRK